jgi:Fic family protein
MYVAPAPSIPSLLRKLPPAEASAAFAPSAGTEIDDRYLHWDKLRHLPPPTGLSSEQWWLRIKFARNSEMRRVPLRNETNVNRFGFTLPDVVLRHLHHIDQRCGGEVAMDEVVISEEQAGQRFLVNSLMEEAIRSSQLEGATTSRRVAKDLLRTGREPRDRSERMIANNYRALQFIRDELGDRLSPSAILELHRILTEGTLDDPSAAGRLQRPGEERVAVWDRDDDEAPIHRPPPAEQLPERMDLLCEFANASEDSEQFVHPVVRAVLLHFWLAYDHPFLDGNGRTARILFFWAMRTRGYWLTEYLPISRFIRKAPAQYARAFMETETDEGDTTYFLIHQLNTIEQAIEDLHGYVQRKIAEVRDVEKLLQDSGDFNHRQLALLADAVRHPDASYSFDSHATSHRVTHETARSDLSGLARRGLLIRRRRGRKHTFGPVPEIAERLRESAA